MNRTQTNSSKFLKRVWGIITWKHWKKRVWLLGKQKKQIEGTLRRLLSKVQLLKNSNKKNVVRLMIKLIDSKLI